MVGKRKRRRIQDRLTREWALRTRIVEGLPLSKLCNVESLRAFQKKTGYPVAPAILIKTGEEQVLFIIAPGEGKGARQAMAMATGSMSDRDFLKRINELRRALRSIETG